MELPPQLSTSLIHNLMHKNQSMQQYVYGLVLAWSEWFATDGA